MPEDQYVGTGYDGIVVIHTRDMTDYVKSTKVRVHSLTIHQGDSVDGGAYTPAATVRLSYKGTQNLYNRLKEIYEPKG